MTHRRHSKRTRFSTITLLACVSAFLFTNRSPQRVFAATAAADTDLKSVCVECYLTVAEAFHYPEDCNLAAATRYLERCIFACRRSGNSEAASELTGLESSCLDVPAGERQPSP